MARRISESKKIPPMTDAMYRSARRNAKHDEPLDVVAAGYDPKADTLNLTLRKGITICFPRKQLWELADAKPTDLREIEIQPGGDGISVDPIDVHISVPGLLTDELGSLFARALGRRSRGRTSPKKAAASRANGRKGGRPKRAVA